MASSIATLYSEELKATMRGRFAWLGAAVVLLAVGGLATVGTQDTWLDGYGIIAYGLVPLGFIPMAAAMMASPRINRFVESVFTAPVRRSDWFTAKFLVLLTLAAAYYVALLPMLLVYAAHVGIPQLLHKFLLWTPGLLLASLTIGTLIGVLFLGRSLAAPAGAGMGVLLAGAGLIPLQELMLARGNGATRTGHLTLASPAVLLKNALGFTLATRNVPATTHMTWISFGLVTFGPLALAAWILLRAQGVETWETTRPQRWSIAAAIAAILLFPVLFAETNYDKPAPPQSNAPAIRGLSRNGTYLAMVEPGGRAPQRCCPGVLNREDWPLATDQPNRRDLLLLLPVEAGKAITDLRTRITGDDGLAVNADDAILTQPSPQLETRAYPDNSGPEAPGGQRIQTGSVVRLPVTLNPTHPWDIGGDRYPFTLTSIFTVAGEAQPRTFTQRAAIEAEVGPAIYQMGAAALVLPLFCLGAAFTRWRRTR